DVGRYAWDQPVMASRITFFKRNNILSDAEFLRVGDAAVDKQYTDQIDLAIGTAVADTAELGWHFRQLPADPAEQHPSSFHRRFPRQQDQSIYHLASASEGQA